MVYKTLDQLFQLKEHAVKALKDRVMCL